MTGKNQRKYITEIIKGTERARGSYQTNPYLQPQKRGGIPDTAASRSIVKEALKLLRPSISPVITIRTVFNSSSVIFADPIELHQLFMNIFTNSVYAIGDKDGEILLELEDFYVDPEYTDTHPDIKTGEYLHIRISDTGHGIKQDILDNIFDPFFTTKPDR